MIFKILGLIFLSCLSAVFYRMGGAKGYNTKIRDVGSSACILTALAFLFPSNTPANYAALAISFGLLWGALSTYRYFLPPPRNRNYTCWYYALHGFMVALAVAPVAILGGHPYLMLIRCVVCAVLVGLWSGLISNAVWEEAGRGFILCATVGLFLLGG